HRHLRGGIHRTSGTGRRDRPGLALLPTPTRRTRKRYGPVAGGDGAMTDLRLSTSETQLTVSHGDVGLVRYVYAPIEPQVESPRPYFHPVHTLDGQLVTLYRPHDHVWHKGIAWSLPNVERLGEPPEHENFWGGVTYLRDLGYQQLPNNGSM